MSQGDVLGRDRAQKFPLRSKPARGSMSPESRRGGGVGGNAVLRR